MTTNWQCLESNPEALTMYVRKLDFDTTDFVFHDLFSTEDWAREMINKPVIGVVLVFPCNEKTLEFKEEQKQSIISNGQFICPDLFFMKQFAVNSCGTVAIYHILLNLQNQFKHLLAEASIVNKFKSESADLSSQKRGQVFQDSEDIQDTHSEAVQNGTTANSGDSNNHFISFVNFSGVLYELDGTKEFPVNHGLTNDDTFLDDTCKIIQGFIDRDPENNNFSLMCLAKKPE